jgi:endonuclease/exonuclease/phosphatase (EEP) superfamily protein YafD
LGKANVLKLRWTLYALGLALALSATHLANGSGRAPAVATAECTGVPAHSPHPSLAPALDGSAIRLLNWNIQKSSQSGWRADLRKFARQSDLLLLQEATLEDNLVQLLETDYHAVFARGYHSGDAQSGVMTLSVIPALTNCYLSHREPWLGTPKATSISRYRLRDREQTLLVVNLHGVNFSLTSEALARQLQDAGAVIRQHGGPVVFSGDFNTWSEERMLLLENTMRELQLLQLTFPQDHRTRVFGYSLDHIFVRGLRVVDSGSSSVASSDHNPIFATLALED